MQLSIRIKIMRILFMSSYFDVKALSPLNLLRNVFSCDSVFVFLVLASIAFSTNSHAEDNKTNNMAIPLEPEKAIIEAFTSHDIVALGEGNHTNEQSHSFRMNLVSNPLFPKTVKDIVIEFGNSYYQPMMDRFIAGEEISPKEVRKAWLYTTQLNQTLDNPVYEEFLYKIRDLNRGDPPMNWKNINTREDLDTARKYLNRDGFVVHLIKYKILAQGRKALVLYGDRHLHRKYLYWEFKDAKHSDIHFAKPNTSIVTQLEQAGAKVFSITTNARIDLTPFQASVKDWSQPSLSLLKGNVLGSINYAHYYPYNYSQINQEGVRERVKSIPSKSPMLEEEYDAILYLGPIDSITYRQLPDNICQDEEYLKIRLKSLGFMKNKKVLTDFCKNK